MCFREIGNPCRSPATRSRHDEHHEQAEGQRGPRTFRCRRDRLRHSFSSRALASASQTAVSCNSLGAPFGRTGNGITDQLSMSMSNDTRQLLLKSDKLSNWLDAQIDGLEISSNFRFRAAGGCLDLAMEHQKAIALLVSRHLYGAAFCLMRPVCESYVRGVWLHKCATDRDLKKFAKEQVPLFADLIRAVETLDSHRDGTLSKMKANSWGVMSSLVHSGFEQVVHRQTETSIEPSYNDDKIQQLVKFANAFSCLAAIAICGLSGNNKTAYRILEGSKDYL